MLKVAKLSKEPEQSLIPPSGEVNADDTVDKFLSRASVQPHAKVTVATADSTKSLVASELAGEQVNQPSTAEAEKVLDLIVDKRVKDAEFESTKDPTFKQIMDEYDQKAQASHEKDEIPYDTKSDINIIKSFPAAIVSGSLFIHQESQRSSSDEHDVIDITPKDVEEGDASA
ncbi:hypothetical protein Tco_1325565, partial [Tanacetum coccineum]